MDVSNSVRIITPQGQKIISIAEYRAMNLDSDMEGARNKMIADRTRGNQRTDSTTPLTIDDLEAARQEMSDYRCRNNRCK